MFVIYSFLLKSAIMCVFLPNDYVLVKYLFYLKMFQLSFMLSIADDILILNIYIQLMEMVFTLGLRKAEGYCRHPGVCPSVRLSVRYT